MTLQEEKNRLRAEMFKRPPCSHPSGVTDEYGTLCDACDFEYEKSLSGRIDAFADALLEEVEKVALTERDKCLARQAGSDDKHKSHGWAMSALTAAIVASAIRSGKGK